MCNEKENQINDEKFTLTLEQLATVMALTASKYSNEDEGGDVEWALANWKVFVPAARQYIENIPTIK